MTRICICGSGTMGLGIAQVAASAGFAVTVYDINDSILGKAKLKLEKDLENLLTKQKISIEKRDSVLQNIRFVSSVNECKADLVIEAIVENLEIKTSLFLQLAAINETGTILASNTSSLRIADIAAKIPHPERVAGLHFFNPAPIM